MRRLCVAAVVMATAGLAFGQLTPEEIEAAKGKRAELSARALAQACEAYHLNPQSKNAYPRALEDLAKLVFGGAPFVRDPRDLLDPWGKQFKYQVAAVGAAGPAPFVWSEREANGKTVVYGKPPPEPKK